MIPKYRRRCPACGGADCPVRHGIYHRRVVNRGKIYERFPVPRFRCRYRGTQERLAVTFSVLPEQLLPRQQASLPLVIWMLHRLLVSYVSLSVMLDELAETFHRQTEPWLPETSTIYRLLRLFALARHRVDHLPSAGPNSMIAELDVGPSVGGANGLVKHRALEMLEILVKERGSPIVGRYHRARFPRLLFGPPRQSQHS